jgi:phage terminase small subunit
MPRTSAAARSAVIAVPPRVRAPASLSETERTVFAGVVKACDPRHFRQSDLPLLSRFCELTALADQAASELRRHGAVINGRASPWIVVQEKCVRGLVALSMRLRLSPQSRIDAKTLGRQQIDTGPKPWED